MIEEVKNGFYAVSFGGGQVDPATGDFVFGVSEGYLIEDGKVTSPCTGATLIGNCLDALAAIDAVGDDFFMKTGICGKGGQKVPVGTGQGHVRVGTDDRGRDGPMSAFAAPGVATICERTRGAAMSEQHCRASTCRPPRTARSRPRSGPAPPPPRPTPRRDTGREMRVHGGEVESLTAATQTGIGIRAWDGQPGRLRLRHRPHRGGRRGARRARRRDGGGRRRGRVRRAARAARDRGAARPRQTPASASGAPARWPSWR